MRLTAFTALAAALALSACVTAPSPADYRAPQPTKSVDAERLWSGRWLEIARTPMSITDGCVAGASNYSLTAPTRVAVRDTCQVDTPTGREKAVEGTGEILDPGTNAKLRVKYFWGFVTWDYWVLDRADDYSWFIATSPTLDKAFIYTREVPSTAERDGLVRRLGELGYDVTRLEFPETL
jgi:apolipoprotein D and lipocalin family protein